MYSIARAPETSRQSPPQGLAGGKPEENVNYLFRNMNCATKPSGYYALDMHSSVCG